MIKGKILFLILFISFNYYGQAQNVPITDFSINNFGQVQLEIEAQADKYYLLTAVHEPNNDYQSITSMTLGVDGTMIISEPLAGFPEQNYTITEHSIDNPDDTDGDGIDDITEFNNMPTQAPLNFAKVVPLIDGTTSITSDESYSDLAVVSADIPWAPFLNDREFVKFAIVNQDSDNPEIYFINSTTHQVHNSFLSTINLDLYVDDVTTGEIVYNPNEVLPNGAIGSYSVNYSFGSAYTFSHTQRTFELLAANMPFLQNNMNHFIGDGGENDYNTIHKEGFVGSRINVVLESDFFSDVDFLPFNLAEGYGFFRQMDLNDNPGSRDIVLYDALPNSLPRVGGIITSVIQTPLSHVNLRAIQDNVPNAYIKEPLLIDSIANLIGKYIYYKVTQDSYEIREASLEEVNAWYEKLRPTVAQIPERDLSQTSILPLDDIEFSMSTSFGAKCSNVATMRKFGFVEGTIPNGYGVPFYFYDEFMKFNGFYDRVDEIITDPGFISDLETRIDMLKDFRKEIKDADMPQWMLDELQAMHDSFPEGTSVRCRSSTNNEDLPGFSGAGLYTSKTQHPDEGHISKSMKQVYASMWNFRAYDEREFYRVDQYIAAMGVLCHPNYDEEKSNGVGVSIDPIYQTEGNFYLNTQVGEFLITNPDANSIPEEILLSEDPDNGYFILRRSNLVPVGQLVMEEKHLNELRSYLRVIHDEFEVLYNVVGAEGFGMDIEYKVTREDQLIIKQARPWVSFWADIKSNNDLSVAEITDPNNSSTLSNSEIVKTTIFNSGLKEMKDFDLSLHVDNQLVETITINEFLAPQTSGEYEFTIPQDFSVIRDYNVGVTVSHPNDGYERNDSLFRIVSKLHLLEAEISSAKGIAKCGEEIEATAIITNHGEITFTNTEIEVVVNGTVVNTFNYLLNIPYQAEVEVSTTIFDNLNPDNNEVILNILSVNGEMDAISNNNTASFMTDLNSQFNYVTLVVNVDDYPQENSWVLMNTNTNEVVDFGDFNNSDFTRDICVDYNSCYTLTLSDTAGDGICCGFGQGNFSVVDANGEIIVTNDGNFGSQAEETFCPNGLGCTLSAEIIISNASIENSSDGSLIINPSQGIAPYQYSVDGGQNFIDNNEFNNLSPGVYNIIVTDASGSCTYAEAVEVGFDMISSINEFSQNQIIIYPNPTEEYIVIEVEETFSITEDIKIEIYNSLGKKIQNKSIIKSNSGSKAIISLNEYPTGSYYVKCYNQTFEKYFKVMKI